jgi:hypothetical protein
VDLCDAAGAPRELGGVVASLLRALGVNGRVFPATLRARIQLLRSRVARRRLLIVLDNAAGEGQLCPLLPGCAGCGVVITSRARLPGLDRARHVALEVLTPDEAVELLGRVAGAGRVAAEREAARQLVQLCDRLPLAVRIAAARLAARPRLKVARLAERLTDERRRLDELAAGDLHVRVSFESSYRRLDNLQRAAFRRLGLLDSTDCQVRIAKRMVERLVDAGLLEVSAADLDGRVRYRLDALPRLFARERALAEEPELISAAGAAGFLTSPEPDSFVVSRQ